jgi:hypothetical protein
VKTKQGDAPLPAAVQAELVPSENATPTDEMLAPITKRQHCGNEGDTTQRNSYERSKGFEGSLHCGNRSAARNGGSCFSSECELEGTSSGHALHTLHVVKLPWRPRVIATRTRNYPEKGDGYSDAFSR